MKGLFAVVRVLVLAVLVAVASDARAETPVPAPAKSGFGEKCVAPTEVMRRDHMTFLKDQRDATLREGRRGMKYSLQGCVECHAVPDPAAPSPEAAQFRTVQPFCSECHSYASVSIDCFACHTDKTRNMRPVLDGLIPTAANTAQMIEDMQAFLRSDQHPPTPATGGQP